MQQDDFTTPGCCVMMEEQYMQLTCLDPNSGQHCLVETEEQHQQTKMHVELQKVQILLVSAPLSFLPLLEQFSLNLTSTHHTTPISLSEHTHHPVSNYTLFLFLTGVSMLPR